MFDLYPNILMLDPAGSAGADTDGDYAADPSGAVEHSICRAVRNGSGQIVRLSAGTDYTFSYVIYMPAGTSLVKPGTTVKVYSQDGEELLACGQVKDFVSNPLGCKLWI